MKTIRINFIIVTMFLLIIACSPGNKQLVKLENFTNTKQVDVLVNNKLFTSYCYSDTLKKPILFPIIAADGITVTRGYPIVPRKGEQVDHPHQTGYWFNYGNVNGLDFWGNSSSLVTEATKHKFGTIRFKGIEKLEDLGDKGALTVMHEWVNSDGEVIIEEHTTFTFSAGKDSRIIDRHTTLTAKLPEVAFPDTKEGAFGIRVSRFLEFPSVKPRTFVDSEGIATTIPVNNDEGVSGNYLSSEGITGAKVWGTRAKWMELYGVNGSDTISMVFMDHPSSFNYPMWWHARDYGLFSGNPWGVKDFTNKQDSLNFKMKLGDSISFRHRLYIKSGKGISKPEIETEWIEFSKE